MGFRRFLVGAILLLSLGFSQAAPASIILPECNGLYCAFSNGTNFICESKGLQCCWNQEQNVYATVAFSYDPYKCCPGTAERYNLLTHICLREEIVEKVSSNESVCASTKRYDTNIQECCLKNFTYGQVHQKSFGGTCCNEKYLTDPQLNCCQGVIYNVTKQACCKSVDGDYTLHNNSNACCLNVPYNSAVQYCGDHGVQDRVRTEIGPICDGRIYDPIRKMCCGDALADIRTHLCHWSTGTLVNKSNFYHNEVCLTDKKLLSYRSGERNGEKQICIDGEKLVILAQNENICYEAPNYKYNTNIHLCCGKEKFYGHGRRDGKKCCKNGVFAYNPSIETCCPNDQIVAVPEQYGRCCGVAGYDSRTHTCKDGEIVEDECAAMRKPFQLEDCILSEQQILDFDQKFHKSGLYVYIATVIGRPTETGRGKRQVRRWKLDDVEQLKNKGKKMTLVPPKGKKFSVTAKKCQCPYELVTGERYIFWSEKKLKKRKGLILNAMQTGYKKSFDAVMPLSKAENLGQFFERLFGTE
ncbi:unnamed protein product [Clavelina lepadiformis]|uniref:Galaxin-like repeats domain-containing protein n=1 Tax=Clavelina lepadiformis TaxID=159417 RepID=A0ABP0FMW1_CLALP